MLREANMNLYLHLKGLLASFQTIFYHKQSRALFCLQDKDDVQSILENFGLHNEYDEEYEKVFTIFWVVELYMGVRDYLPYCGIIQWNYFWNLYVFEFFGIYIFFQIMENINLSKRWCRLWFHKVVQATVHAMASYDGPASILGSERVLELRRSEAK